MAKIATQLMLGKKLSELNLKPKKIPHYGVKESVFPFNMYPEVDPLLGPEMRSTGEVLGMAESFGLAFFKAEEAAQPSLPTEGTVLLSMSEKNKKVVDLAKSFTKMGFKIKATEGTCAFLKTHGIESQAIMKLHEGRPNIVDDLMNRQIHLVINTPIGKRGQHDDSYIRKTAIKYKVPYITTLAAALASAKGIEASQKGRGGVKSVQEYHADIV